MTRREATAPPEDRGLNRDQVRLMVTRPGSVQHAVFCQLGDHLRAGDLLVVNTSATLSAALNGRRQDGSCLVVHFSTELADGSWVVELRPSGRAVGAVSDARTGERVGLSAGAHLDLLMPYAGSSRLWQAAVAVEGPVPELLAHHGRPITYSYLPRDYPLEVFQTVFARQPGSAEMPSAGRPFSDRLVVDLVARGVSVAPIVLHTGVSSPERGEPPLPEPYDVPPRTADLVELTRRSGGRVVAVGTTVTRALETLASPDGSMRSGRGWTDLVLSRDRPARVVGGLVTGWHDPGASHLQLLEAVAGPDLVGQAYDAADHDGGYLWHELGDSCLLLP